MPRKPESRPGIWACSVAKAIQQVIDKREMSARELARRIDKSNNYVAMRLRCEVAFTLSDIEIIGQALGFDPLSFLAGVEAGAGATSKADVALAAFDMPGWQEQQESDNE